MDIKEYKSALRTTVRKEIAELAEEYIRESNEGLYENVVNLEEFKNAQTILVFYSIEREPDTLRIAERALEMGKIVSFPYCFRGGIMEARAVRNLSELAPAMLGIPAPMDGTKVIEATSLEFVIVPALAYDMQRYRLGYGGGYYDRYLKGLSAFTAGVGRERLLKETLPVQDHDIAVKCVVTESRILRSL